MTRVEYVRFAADLAVLVGEHPKQERLFGAVNKRLREELGKLHVEVNEQKSRLVELAKQGSFGFLGFEFRRVRSRRGAWRPQYVPRREKQKALRRKVKEIFRSYRSQPVQRVVERINPILRGWVNYYAIGHSGRCFCGIKRWVEKKVRRHLMRARKRSGFGWKRWSSPWLYNKLGLFNEYRLRRPTTKARPVDRSDKPWHQANRSA